MTVVICLDEGGGVSFFSRPQSSDRVLNARIASLGDVMRITRGDDVPNFDLVDTLVIYRWNRKYPRDSIVPLSPYDAGMTLVSINDFAGSSHGRITEEVWKRRTS